MQSQDVPMATAPPAFPKLPKSALLSKLQSFLPVMEQENKKLEEAVAAGEGAKHSIEVDEDETQAAAANAQEDAADKPQVIEMNFALGMMEDEDKSDDDSSDDDDASASKEIDLKSSIMAATGAQIPQSSDKESGSFDLKLSRESAKPHPLIQELN